MMNWIEYAKRSIAAYPTLFAKSNLDDSVFSVAHQTFININQSTLRSNKGWETILDDGVR